ncbi:TVP38/TMEM64 family protein [Granulicatella balaenopterae]|nr:TVP38/TMEM64 family protein [Granulicatella balaenopterae]
MNRRLIRLVTIIGLVLTIFIGYQISTTQYFSVGGPFQNFIARIGIYGPLLFIVVQITQVIYPVIPGGVTCMVGHVLFGPLWGFIYNFTGIMIGSICNFILARKYGYSFARAFVSEKTYQKYIAYLANDKKFERFLIGAFILPGFPDDFLCMVAGLSKMSLKRFVAISFLAKPATLYLYTIIGLKGIQYILNLL